MAMSCNCAYAQVAISIGPPPVCPYGYYETPRYNCAPDGYYGPEWFAGGIFIGAGPWFHGPAHFYGHVDHHFDYRNVSGGIKDCQKRRDKANQWEGFRRRGTRVRRPPAQ